MKGFERGRNLDKLGMEAQDTSELFFDDMVVPAANLLGDKFLNITKGRAKEHVKPGAELRSLQAQEAAEKMAVKLLIPMILFIFPAAFVVAVGPACITMVKLLGNG